MNEFLEAGYKPADFERFVEQPTSQMKGRGEFARDRARVLHSAAFRKLSAKTQVLSPTSGDFARTRLTHSLEVAQVGRELANSLGVNPDLVDMGCLAHDLGHPPFGHNGEAALNFWAADIGGFEGNAQTFRILTRLEPKIYDQSGISRGLNLTRASLDAATKYPWQLSRAAEFGSTTKFGVYEDDLEVFGWMRHGAPDGAKCVEAQIMDFADDVAYSVHDFEDSIVEGFVIAAEISDSNSDEALIDDISKWSGGTLARVQLEEALASLRTSKYWLHEFDGSPRHLAQLKNLASDIIGSFVSRTTQAILQNASKNSLTRYRAGVIVPSKVRSEIAVLKGIVASSVMTHNSRQPYYEDQRSLLIELADTLLAKNGFGLDPQATEAWGAAHSDHSKKRVIVDSVASLTDPAAIALHKATRA
ncbi:deoxyguanosinetriphosphate triphosphohydrolase [Aquiluna sp.]|jgi:dGTPase|nr:deoxyguanosinetriphosphate triphosphohydrolase [Aquiluna sp.]MDA9099529.1 deoxyguanosinetriphosphate triphosphohydrolase [Aquiluna sp.]